MELLRIYFRLRNERRGGKHVWNHWSKTPCRLRWSLREWASITSRLIRVLDLCRHRYVTQQIQLMAVMTTATIIDQFRTTRITTRWNIDSRMMYLFCILKLWIFFLVFTCFQTDSQNNVQERIEEEDEDDEADVDNLDQVGPGATDNTATSTNNGRRKKKSKKSKNR